MVFRTFDIEKIDLAIRSSLSNRHRQCQKYDFKGQMDQKMELNRPILPTAISYVVSVPILRSPALVHTRPYPSVPALARPSSNLGENRGKKWPENL